MNVDGADNRDNQYSGPLLTFTTESLEQFQLASSQFTAADGRTGGAAVTMVTKSGTNAAARLGVRLRARRQADAKDYFTKQANGEKAPFSRQQFGGSIGGPIIRNRMFFFGAHRAAARGLEQVRAGTQLQPARTSSARRATRARSRAGHGQSRPPAHRRAAGRPADVHGQGQRAAQQRALGDGPLRRPARRARRGDLDARTTTTASRTTSTSTRGAPSASTTGCWATPG